MFRTGSHSSRTAVRALAALLAFGLVAAACGDDDDSTATTEAGGAETTEAGEATGTTEDAGEPVAGGTLVMGIEADTSSPWTPAQMTCPTACHNVAKSVYDNLVLIDENGEAVPNLATFEHNDDYTEWRFTAREGVTFHDGTPFDGAAILDNLQRQQASFLTGKVLADVASVELDPADPMTVVITTKVPWVTFPSILSAQIGYMASPTWLAAVDQDPTLATKPVGTGPFVFESYTPGEGYSGTKNPNYWREGLPYLDRIEYRIIVDGETRLNALLAGDIDMMQTNNGDVIAQLREQPEEFPMPEVKGGETVYFLLNVGDETSPLSDERVRCALAKATDTATIRAALTADVPELANGPFAPDTVGYLEDTGYPAYDPDAAAAEIEAWEAENGPLQIGFATTTDGINLLTGQLIQQMWTEAGVDTSVEQIEQSQFIVTALRGDFEVFQWRNHGTGGNPDAENVWWNSANALPEGELALNFGRIRDSVIDENLAVLRSNPDPAARQEAAEAINRRFGEQCYNLWYNWTVWGLPHQADVHGVFDFTAPGGEILIEGAGGTTGSFFPQAVWKES